MEPFYITSIMEMTLKRISNCTAPQKKESLSPEDAYLNQGMTASLRGVL